MSDKIMRLIKYVYDGIIESQQKRANHLYKIYSGSKFE